MDANKLDMYVMTNAKYFPAEKMAVLRDKLSTADDSRYTMISSIELKDPTTITLISVFLGPLGIDRFMIGDTGMGILKILTCGLCGILCIVDWFTIGNKAKELNYNKVMQMI